MYTCEQCRETVAPGVKSRKLIEEKRFRSYWTKYTEPQSKREKWRLVSTGWEIVKEKQVCPACAEHNGNGNGTSQEEKRPRPEGFRFPIGHEFTKQEWFAFSAESHHHMVI